MKKINLIKWLSRNSHEKQKPQRFGRYAAMLIMLLTLGVGQMWAGAGFFETYLTYSYNGTTGSKSCTSSGTETTDLGTLTADFNITALYLKYWKEGSGNMCGGLMEYYIDSDLEYQPTWTWSDIGGNDHQLVWTGTWRVAQYNTGASGAYTFWYRFKTWGDSNSSGGCSTNYYIPTDGSSKNKFTYKIAPPALSSFTITPTGAVAGSGTSGDPYIIPYGGDLTLVSSGGSKARTDANSSIEFSLDNSSWGTTSTYTTTTIEDITSTTKASVNLYARCKNTSDATLLGAVKTQTIYYRAAALNTITLNKGTDGTSAGSMTIREYATEYTSYTAATKTGWSLKGYYTAASDGTQIIDANGNLIANKSGYTNSSGQWIGGTTTLYAQWKQTYAVTYYANYPAGATSTSGSVPTDATEYSSGATVTVKTNSGSLAAGGYTFAGWNTQPDGLGTDRAASSTFSISANTALYAKWTENMTTVTISVNPAGSGTLTLDAAAFTSGNSTTAGVATNHTVVATAYPGYKFSSWNLGGNATGTSSTNTYTLKGNGSGSTGTLRADFTTMYAYVEGRFQVKNAARNSTTYTGVAGNGYWATDSRNIKFNYDGTNHRYELHTYMKPSELSAQLSSNTQYFTIQTSTSTGSLTGGSLYTPASKSPTTNQKLTAAGTATKRATSTTLNRDDSFWFESSDATGYAILYFDESGVWYTLEHTLNYNGNGSTSGSAPSEAYYNNGSNATAASNPYSKTNYTFGGWNTNQYITGTSYAAGASVPMSANTTLYAKWTRSITLNQNGGGSGSTSVTATYNCATLPTITAPSKTGYTFGGWNTANDGSGDIVINTDGEFLPITGWCDSQKRFTRTASGATLYAKWTQIVTLNANTSYHGSGDNTSATIILNATAKSSITHCTPATGYHLVGYYTAETGGTKVLNADGSFASSSVTDYITSSKWIKAGATTLYAHYEPNTYQVHFNGNGSDGGSMSNETGFTYDEAKALTACGFTKTGYDFAGWATSASGVVLYDDQEEVTNLTATNNGTAELYAKWTENNYTVTVEAGEGGSVGSTSVTGHISTLANLPTATPSNGYYFVNWTTTAGTLTNNTSATTGKINGLTSDATVTANFAKIYYLKGSKTEMGSWSTENDMSYAGSANTYSVTLTLAAKTEYEFKIYNRQTSAVYGASSTSFTRASYSKTGMTTEGGNTYNIHITTDAAGDYTFTYVYAASVGSMQISVTYPTAYTVTFGSDGHASSVTATASATGTLTSGDYVGNGETVTFAQTPNTGYNLKGWYTTVDGSTSAGLDGSNQLTVNANKTVYAQYNANTYAVTFNYATNGGSKASGSDANNATYDQATITTPVVYKDGYCLDGWYSAASSGTKVINADGTFVENVSISEVQWTDGDGKWKKTGTATVYAVYTIPDTIMLDPNPEVLNAFAAQHSGKDTLVVSPRFDCTPTGSWNISYLVGYSENKTLLEPQPTIIYGTGAGVGHDTIRMPAAANTYMIISILRTGSTRGSGTEVTRDTMNYVVEDLYTVKARRIVDGMDIEDAATWSGYPSSRSTEVRAPLEVNGYVLDHWELGVGIDTVNGEGRIVGSYEEKKIYAHNNGTVKLHYKPKPNTVFFMDAFDMYWYSTHMKMYDYGTSTGYWTNGYGADSHDSKVGDTVKMASHGTPEVMMMAIGSSSTNFAITNKRMDNYGHFHGASEGNEWARVIYRTDFNGATSMFVPVSKEPRPVTGSDFLVLNTTETGAAHYYRGFWVKYSPNADSTGYYLHVYNQVAQAGAKTIQTLPLRLTQTGEGGTWELTAKMDLEANKTYGFKITKATGASTKTWYSYNGTLTAADHEGKVLDGTTNNIGLTTTSAGDYTFHVFCKAVTPSNPITASDVQGQLAVTVDYAAVSGDYRVIYSDATQTEVIASPSIHPRENGQDTVSFFIRTNATDRVMKIQKFTSDWADSCTIDLSTITKDSVYVIYLQQNEGKLAVTGIDYYDGDFYIRTDCVDEHKWDYKQSLDNHRMNPSDYGLTDKQPIKFSHYYVHWIDEGGNVKFVVANKYAPCISDTLITDTYANVAGGNLPSDADAGTNIGASVRFMYNKGTNAVNRAYLAGAQGVAYDPDYLKLSTSGTKMSSTEGEPASIPAITFTDLKNFVYQAEIKAKPGLTANLTAEYNNNTQYFRGSDTEDEEILGGTTTEWQSLLLTYDFKVNRLICAWQPGNDSINGDVPINADIMVIRVGQEDAKQIVFKTNESKLSSVKYIYGVMQFNYDDMVGHMYTWGYTAYEFCMYYISFPYDVLVNDIMAPGRMGSEWRLQRYNGAKRAADGWFAGDGVTTFWEDVQAGDTLHAYEGYSLLLNRRIFNDGSSSVWTNKGTGSKLYMYFPSKDATIGVVANKTVDVVVPSHLCEKDVWFTQDAGYYDPSTGTWGAGARNHKVVDSHWNMIGTPLFEDHVASTIASGPTIEGETLQYIYEWNPAGNVLGIRNALTTSFKFRTMYSYMAQYAGTIRFVGSAVNKIVAANRETEKKNYTMNLELFNEDAFIGRTYVELRENADDAFLINEDVYMVKNGVNADLYTFAGAYEAGANVLTVGDHIVPVGIDVKAAGTYTFSMPDNFDGEVILVDNYMQTRTNLAIDDYEIALPSGVISDRFFLEITVNKAPTAIDGVGAGEGTLRDGKVHKFIMNDQMYILKDGVIYDATGKRVQ